MTAAANSLTWPDVAVVLIFAVLAGFALWVAAR